MKFYIFCQIRLQSVNSETVYHFVNNYINRAGCGFKCASEKTLKLFHLCNRIRRQVSDVVISKIMYQY